MGVALLAGAVALGITGYVQSRCPQPAATTPTDVRRRAADEYLSSVVPVNSAQATFYAQAEKWNGSTTGAEAINAARPLLAALETIDRRLQGIANAYPSAASSLEADRRAVETLRTDVLALSGLN